VSGIGSFLRSHQERLGLGSRGIEEPISFVLVTPRFRASRHVVVLVLGRRSQPALVVKIARLAEDTAGVDHEADVLHALQEAGPHRFETIPRVVLREQWRGHPVLVETALVGRPLAPAYVRRHPEQAVAATLEWLDQLAAVPAAPDDADDRFDRLLARPLSMLGDVLPQGDERDAAARTLAQLEPLRRGRIASVAEHGDLSDPNLLLLPNGRVGVVDWELAELRGFPAHDLFVFLAYVAVARARATSADAQLRAFRAAFATPTGWLRPYAVVYADALGIERSQLRPLFLACWARITTGRLERLLGTDGAVAASAELADWLRHDRYYRFWRNALASSRDFSW
jgi:aminoglycoside phosphotransferase